MSSHQTQRVASPATQYTHADLALARQTLDAVQTQYSVLLSSMGTLNPSDTIALFTQLAEIKHVIIASPEGAPLRDLCASLMAALQPPTSPVVLTSITSRLPPVPPLAAERYLVRSTIEEDGRASLAASMATQEDSPLLDGSKKEKKQTSPGLWARLSRKKEEKSDELTSLLRAHSEAE